MKYIILPLGRFVVFLIVLTFFYLFILVSSILVSLWEGKFLWLNEVLVDHFEKQAALDDDMKIYYKSVRWQYKTPLDFLLKRKTYP